MDDTVARSIAKWPDVPAVFGWLSLDRRGNWLIRSASASQRFERIAHLGLREFIGRNYAADERGRWFFQNGPQRVFVTLAYAPFVMHYEGERLLDQCGREIRAVTTYQDDEGSVLILGQHGIGLLDDRDLERYIERAAALPRLARAEVAARFGFMPQPAP